MKKIIFVLLFVWLALVNVGARRTISLVAAGDNFSTLNTTGASLIVGSVDCDSVGRFDTTDSKGNSWTYIQDNVSVGNRASTAYIINPVVGTNHTFQLSGSCGFGGSAISAFSGIRLTSPLDQVNSGTPSGTSVTGGAITTTAAGELVVSIYGGRGSASAIDSGMSISAKIDEQGCCYAAGNAWVVQGAAGSITPTWTTSNNTKAIATASFFSDTPLTVPVPQIIIRKPFLGLSR